MSCSISLAEWRWSVPVVDENNKVLGMVTRAGVLVGAGREAERRSDHPRRRHGRRKRSRRGKERCGMNIPKFPLAHRIDVGLDWLTHNFAFLTKALSHFISGVIDAIVTGLLWRAAVAADHRRRR